MHLVRYRQAQTALMETPPSLPEDFVVDAAAARALVEQALREGRRYLDPVAANDVLRAYGIPSARLWVAADAEAAVRFAQPLLDEACRWR